MRHPVRRAEPSEAPELAGILADAFADYPWTRWTVPAEGYIERLRRLQYLYLVHFAMTTGSVYTDTDGRGVAAFVPPGDPAVPPSALDEILDLHADRIGRVAAVEQALTMDGIDERAWTLATVGVRPSAQGHGLGGDLIRAGLAALDDDAVGCRLDTSSESNLRFYDKLGFRIVGHTQPPGGPRVWRLFREPRSGSVPR